MCGLRCGPDGDGVGGGVADPLADTHWEALHPPLLEAGSYAIDPAPYGPPWRQWAEVGAREAAERGRFAPFGALSDGPSDTVLLAPGDIRGTGLILERAGATAGGSTGGTGQILPAWAAICR
ncbi:hypothetical protein ACFQ51_39850 [Streptomyces kaempferi]